MAEVSEKNQDQEVDETRPEITVSYNRKVNLGDYNSAELRATVRENPAPDQTRRDVIDRLKKEAIVEVHDGLEKATDKDLKTDLKKEQKDNKEESNGKNKLKL